MIYLHWNNDSDKNSPRMIDSKVKLRTRSMFNEILNKTNLCNRLKLLWICCDRLGVVDLKIINIIFIKLEYILSPSQSISLTLFISHFYKSIRFDLFHFLSWNVFIFSHHPHSSILPFVLIDSKRFCFRFKWSNQSSMANWVCQKYFRLNRRDWERERVDEIRSFVRNQ